MTGQEVVLGDDRGTVRCATDDTRPWTIFVTCVTPRSVSGKRIQRWSEKLYDWPFIRSRVSLEYWKTTRDRTGWRIINATQIPEELLSLTINLVSPTSYKQLSYLLTLFQLKSSGETSTYKNPKYTDIEILFWINKFLSWLVWSGVQKNNKTKNVSINSSFFLVLFYLLLMVFKKMWMTEIV